jgi:predicted O-methyltransferase YrrM
MTVRRRRVALAVVASFVVACAVAWWWPEPDPYAGLAASPALEVIRRMGHGHGVTPADGRLLHDEVLARGYRRGVDVGTAHGYAALWLGLAMQRAGGQLITIEIDPDTARVAAANLREARLANVELRVEDALLEIPRLEGEIDFAFFDPGVEINRRLLDLVSPRLRPGGAVFAHNANFFWLTQRDYLAAIRAEPWQTSWHGFGWRISRSVKRPPPREATPHD